MQERKHTYAKILDATVFKIFSTSDINLPLLCKKIILATEELGKNRIRIQRDIVIFHKYSDQLGQFHGLWEKQNFMSTVSLVLFS